MSLIKSALFVITLCCSSLYANVTSYFNHIKNDRETLYTFLKLMPKGGELHYHLAGGPYPETMLALAAKGFYCLDTNTLTINKGKSQCNGVKIKELLTQPDLYLKTIKAWSMKEFTPGNESGHDHFFNSFSKYMPLVFDYRPQLIADVMQRAAQQHELYLEIMDIPDNAHSLSFGALIKDTTTYNEKKQLLLANPDFQNNITHTVAESDRGIEQAYNELGCNQKSQNKACQVHVTLLYYVLREQPLNDFFAQALNAFAAVSQSKGALVGVNLVQPEDGTISLRDYRQQMKIFNFLHQSYPEVKISLHAGELAPGFVAPEELSYHIHDALYTGKAQRIGHGVDIAHESKAEETLKYMSTHQIPVEINLTSNLKILNIADEKHPLKNYLAHDVPVVLSTDDEGVLRTNLTQEHLTAVLKHHLSYSAIKLINRNALTYSFLSGKSLWSNPQKSILVTECHDLNSKKCHQYLANNKKATLQWQLEQKLIDFEKQYL